MSSAKRFIALCLALVVFISSGGVVMAVHYCSKQANKEVTLFKNNTCCSKNSSACESFPASKSLKKKCCDLKVTYHKIDISTVFSEKVTPDVQALIVIDFLNNFSFFAPPVYNSSLANKAPPFFTGGRTFLSISQQFLI
jgi:hypothetical protein